MGFVISFVKRGGASEVGGNTADATLAAHTARSMQRSQAGGDQRQGSPGTGGSTASRVEPYTLARAAEGCWRRAQVYDTVWERAARRQGITGSLYWHCAAASYPDYDGTTVYLQPEKPPGPHDARVLELIRGHARAMAGCSALPVPGAAGDGRSPQPSRSPGQMIQSLGRRIRDKLDRQ